MRLVYCEKWQKVSYAMSVTSQWQKPDEICCEILVVGLVVTWLEHIASPFRCFC